MSPPVLQCPGCEKTYTLYASLRGHVKGKHPHMIHLIKTPEADCSVNECPECGLVFKWHNSLKKHVKLKHPDQRHKVSKRKEGDYTCHYCMQRCARKTVLKRHINRLHDFRKDRPHLPPKREVASSKYYVCPLCKCFPTQKKRFTRKGMFDHFTNHHQITITSSVHTFKNIDEFKLWKIEIEKNTFTEFIRGGRRKGEIIQFSYRCHRSGRSKLKENSKRLLKAQGTKKIDAFCPAGLMCREFGDGTIEVKFIETHIGHDNELEFVHLKEDERRCLASQIAAQVPFDDILKQAREDLSESGVSRKHLLTRKDLHNIAKEFNLHEFKVTKRTESLSVEEGVRKLSRDVLFYKRHNEWCHSYPSLQYEDFLLVVMTSPQTELYKLYGSDFLFIDGTHRSNKYKYHVHTLSTIDEDRKVFPCAFLITDRSDSVSLEIFFQSIKSRLSAIKPQVFMSDMTDLYYNAWRNVMGEPKHKLYSPWHVDRVWRQNLIKIKNPVEKEDTIKVLHTLMEEPDKRTFQRLLQYTIDNLESNATTLEFGQYFRAFCRNTPELFWAFCHRERVWTELNINANIEQMYGNIKHIYNKGLAKGLGNAIGILLQFVNNKNFERTISNKGQINLRIANAKKAHERITTVDCNDCVEKTSDGWEVKSRNSSELYKVVKTNDTSKCNCSVVCSECKICMHTYSCSCLDNTNKYNLCEHIHLVAKFVKIKSVQDRVNNKLLSFLRSDILDGASAGIDSLSNETLNTSHTTSSLSRTCVTKSENPDTTNSNQLQDKIEKCREMMNLVFDSVRTEKEISAVHDILKTMPLVLSAIRQNDSNNISLESVASSSFIS